MRIATIFLAFVAASQAQQGRISGPVSGWVFEPVGRTLRPVRGVPGAAVFGEAAALQFSLAAAYVSPASDSAVAVAADGSLHFLRIAEGVMAERPWHDSVAVPDDVVFSPSGASAALISGSKAAIVTGLPDSPALSGTIDVLGGSRRGARTPVARRLAVAVSDDGRYLLTTLSGSARLLSPSGEDRRLRFSGRAYAVAFAAGGHTAAVATSMGVVLFSDLAASDAGDVLAGSLDGMDESSTVAFSADGTRILLAGSSAPGIAMFDRSGGRTGVSCDCSPARLIPMGGTLFRLNDPGDGPMWLLDASSDPKTVFVPALTAN